jgi:hypothetical protein
VCEELILMNINEQLRQKMKVALIHGIHIVIRPDGKLRGQMNGSISQKPCRMMTTLFDSAGTT